MKTKTINLYSFQELSEESQQKAIESKQTKTINFMNYGTHILKTPNGRFTFVGSVPIELMNAVEPTRSDVMAGRTIDGIALLNGVQKVTIQPIIKP